MGWDFISEMWPPLGLLFIPRLIYEYGQQWWNDDVDKWKLPICPPELWQFYHLSNLVAKQDEMAKEIMNLALAKYICSYFEVIFNLP
jgi:hypothetical protein